MGVDLEKKRKLLLYPIEYQRGCPCEWVLGFARAAVMQEAAQTTGARCVIGQHNRQRSNYKD